MGRGGQARRDKGRIAVSVDKHGRTIDGGSISSVSFGQVRPGTTIRRGGTGNEASVPGTKSKLCQDKAVRIFLMASPISGAAPSFITTVQVIPALTNTSGGTCVRWMPTGIRCACRTHVNVGLMEERSSGPSLLSCRILVSSKYASTRYESLSIRAMTALPCDAKVPCARLRLVM